MFKIVLLVIFIYLLFRKNGVSQLIQSGKKSLRNYKEALHTIDVDPQDIHDDPNLVNKQKKNKTELT